MDPAVIASAQKRFSRSDSEGQRRQASLAASANERLEIHPGLWAGYGLVRTGAGTALVGSHAEVASLIEEYAAIGIEHFILSGQPHLEEAYWVGEGVLPELRRRGLARRGRDRPAGPRARLTVAAAAGPRSGGRRTSTAPECCASPVRSLASALTVLSSTVRRARVREHPRRSRRLPELDLEAIDLSDRDFWAEPPAVRHAVFDKLRTERPFAFFDEPTMEGMEPGPGYYAVTRLADLDAISSQPAVFCSGQGAVSIQDIPADLSEFYGSMISMDDPRHARIRRIVAKTFTPRMLEQVVDSVVGIVDDVLAEARAKAEAGDGSLRRRRRHRRPHPAADHLRHDGRARGGPAHWS